MNTPNQPIDQKYITRKKLRERYGDISQMTVWRWEHDEKLDFPGALNINGRKYYDLVEIEAWERRRAVAAVPSYKSSDRSPTVAQREFLTRLENMQAALGTHETYAASTADADVVAKIYRIRCSLQEAIEATRSIVDSRRSHADGSTPCPQTRFCNPTTRGVTHEH